MRKLLLAIVACVLTAGAAKADSITLTGPTGTLPVSTQAIIDMNTSITTAGGVFTLFVDVTSGPDAGGTATIAFTCAFSPVPVLCSDDVKLVLFNGGTAGVDTITASLVGSTLTGSTTVTWGVPTGTPEPGTLSLLAAALVGTLVVRRRTAK